MMERTAILERSTQGVSEREIARALGISRAAVRKVRQQILELFDNSKGNLVRVHEELVASLRTAKWTPSDYVFTPPARH